MNDTALSTYSALIYVMVMTSAADRDMTDRELRRIGHMVKNLPVFEGFDVNDLVPVAEACAAEVSGDAGLDAVLDRVADALPDHLRETAYVLACEVAAADLHLEPEELRMLQMLGHVLRIDRLISSALQRGVRARHMTL